jgi:hypothetical protein
MRLRKWPLFGIKSGSILYLLDKPGGFMNKGHAECHTGDAAASMRIPARANGDSERKANGIPGRRRTVLGA